MVSINPNRINAHHPATPPRAAESVQAHSDQSAGRTVVASEDSFKDTVMLDNRKASWTTDALAIGQLTGSGFLYRGAAKEAAKEFRDAPPFADAPVVALEDPFLILPGWTTPPDKFDDLVGHLLKHPANGERAVYLKEGLAFSDKECTQPTTVNKEDMVFVSVFDDVLSPPDKTAPQVADAVSMIKDVHGEKVDVLGYSMGGIAVRKMLDEGSQTVDQVAFLGSAHQGTRFATLSSYVIKRDIGFAMKLGNLHPGHLPAMEWMLPTDGSDADNPSKLALLNQNIERQKQNATEMVSLGSAGYATINRSWGGTEGGDGLVPSSSVKLDGVPTVLLEGRGSKQHGYLPSDTDAFNEMAQFFNWS